MRLISLDRHVLHQPPREPSRRGGRLGGSLVAIVTPFRTGKVDAEAFARLCDWQITRGSSGLVVGGSTGEGAALSTAEHGKLVAIAKEAAAGRAPVIAGCGAPATDAAAMLARAAVQHGADGLLCAPPPYSKPTQSGIVAHVRAVAHAADRPVILYDVPSRTGVAIADEIVARLAKDGLISAIKDAGGDLARPVLLRALCGDELVQLSGDDGTAPGYRAMGGHGCISVTANLVPALCAQMHRAWDNGDREEFGRIRDALSPLHQALFSETNPIPIKAAMAMADLCHGGLRLPLTRASEATLERLRPLVARLTALDAEAAVACRLSMVP